MLVEMMRTFQMKSITDIRTNDVANQAIIATPKLRDLAGDAVVDPNAEYIVVGLELSASADGVFQLTDGSAVKGLKHWILAKTSRGLIETWVPMGRGTGLCYTTTITGDLNVTVHFIRKNYSSAKQA